MSGKALSPVLLSGQMHGGIAMGVGQTMMEHMQFDPETAQPLTATFMDYAMPRADMLPELDFTIREVPTMVNPVGAKGVGEAGIRGLAGRIGQCGDQRAGAAGRDAMSRCR